MKLEINNYNYYNFKHKEVYKKLEGELTYCGTFSVKGWNFPVAVYHNANPNRAKDHKDYLLLYTIKSHITNEPVLMVTGMDAEEMEKERLQIGKYCPKCEEVLYSIHRHDYRECSCGKCSIDGGKDYVRASTYGETIEIDLIKGEVVRVCQINTKK